MAAFDPFLSLARQAQAAITNVTYISHSKLMNIRMANRAVLSREGHLKLGEFLDAELLFASSTGM